MIAYCGPQMQELHDFRVAPEQQRDAYRNLFTARSAALTTLETESWLQAAYSFERAIACSTSKSPLLGGRCTEDCSTTRTRRYYCHLGICCTT